MTTIFKRDDPNTWPFFRPLIMAHDVGARAIVRPPSLAAIVRCCRGYLAFCTPRSGRKGFMAVPAPMRWRRLIAATTTMFSLSPISATTDLRRGSVRDVRTADYWPSHP